MGATTHTTALQLPSRAGEESPFSSRSATNPTVLDSRRDNDARVHNFTRKKCHNSQTWRRRSRKLLCAEVGRKKNKERPSKGGRSLSSRFIHFVYGTYSCITTHKEAQVPQAAEAALPVSPWHAQVCTVKENRKVAFRDGMTARVKFELQKALI
ncbi:hypothetical protein PVAP13_3KG451500 [Panicum virgatum]|uniref:Uncharacterized protein n=1 Tax=Panicum virgatum TaxID=38727 RepID=A0A8T0V8F0_PANVG|nr:hypothetical protein PVAP13_3KG451500 [Panicum virgatum]